MRIRSYVGVSVLLVTTSLGVAACRDPVYPPIPQKDVCTGPGKILITGADANLSCGGGGNVSVLTQSGAANANCATDSNGYYVCADCGACGLDHTEPGKVVCKKGADCQIPRACNGDETRCVSAGELQTCIAGQWQVRQCGASEECWTSTGSPPACRPKLNGTIRIGQSAIAFSNPSLIGQTFGASTSLSLIHISEPTRPY